MANLIKRRVSYAVLSLILALSLTSLSRADVADEGWGDMGYAKTGAVVEPIPDALASGGATEPSPEALAANPDAVGTYSGTSVTTSPSSATSTDVVVATSEEPASATDNEAAARAETQAKFEASSKKSTAASKNSSSKSSTRTFGNISTARNTYGVMTEERAPVQFYVAPFGGMTSVIGNTTVNSTPRFALGAEGGLLLSPNFFLGAVYTYSEQNLSAPRTNSTSGSYTLANDVFALKSNHIEVAAKMFFLGRESRVRPFFGGGFGWAKNFLNYTTANLQALGYQPGYASDFTINQFDGFGEIGAEVAITRALVASASFKLRGILSTTTSANTAEEAQAFDTAKVEVGSSLSRSASYSIGAGLGIYF